MEKQNQNNSSRRDFPKNGSLAGMSLSTVLLTSFTEPMPNNKKKNLGILSEISKKLMT